MTHNKMSRHHPTLSGFALAFQGNIHHGLEAWRCTSHLPMDMEALGGAARPHHSLLPLVLGAKRHPSKIERWAGPRPKVKVAASLSI
jgi:hypothetical protein